MSCKIDIYTKPYCSYCQRAKELLRIKGVPFFEHTVEANRNAFDPQPMKLPTELLPQIYINSRLIGGCAELFDLDERGELDALLTEPKSVAGSPR